MVEAMVSFFDLKAMTLKILGECFCARSSHRGLPLRAELAATNIPIKEIHILPGPEDSRIAWKTAQMLEGMSYSRHPLDAEFCERIHEFVSGEAGSPASVFFADGSE